VQVLANKVPLICASSSKQEDKQC